MATAAERYEMETRQCKKLLDQIRMKLDTHTPPNYDVNWGHVGDLSQVWQELNAIREFLSHDEEE